MQKGTHAFAPCQGQSSNPQNHKNPLLEKARELRFQNKNFSLKKRQSLGQLMQRLGDGPCSLWG